MIMNATSSGQQTISFFLTLTFTPMCFYLHLSLQFNNAFLFAFIITIQQSVFICIHLIRLHWAAYCRSPVFTLAITFGRLKYVFTCIYISTTPNIWFCLPLHFSLKYIHIYIYGSSIRFESYICDYLFISQLQPNTFCCIYFFKYIPQTTVIYINIWQLCDYYHIIIILSGSY